MVHRHLRFLSIRANYYSWLGVSSVPPDEPRSVLTTQNGNECADGCNTSIDRLALAFFHSVVQCGRSVRGTHPFDGAATSTTVDTVAWKYWHSLLSCQFWLDDDSPDYFCYTTFSLGRERADDIEDFAFDPVDQEPQGQIAQ